MARTGYGGEVEGTDEEFLFHLSRGGELLAKGESEPARVSLERALVLRPRDSKVLGLLGQAYYRLGLYDQAAEIYRQVVEQNPAEATAYVNWGLANLKAKHLPEAVKHFAIALDLSPSHKKAMGYLGKALLDSGEPAKAREWFVKVGSEAGVARCDQLLAGKTAPPVIREQPVESLPPPAHEERPPESQLPRGYPELASFTDARQARHTTGEPFSEEGGTLVITVRDALFTRIDGLYAVRGALEFTPAMKQFHGRTTDSPFGEGARRVHQATGNGALHISVGGRCFIALDLGGEAGYFREETVFAFESTVAFENGRVAAHAAPDLNLVHLRGSGCFLLATHGAPQILEVVARQPLRVPLEALVGWLGGLTPRVILLTEPSATNGAEEWQGMAMVELTGDGRALVDPVVTLERASRD